jgi:hypothetical protein
VIASLPSRRRWYVGGVAILAAIAVVSAAAVAGSWADGGGAASFSASASLPAIAAGTSFGGVDTPGPVTPGSTASPSLVSSFQPIDMFAPEPTPTPAPTSPPGATSRPGRTGPPPIPLVDPGRDIPDQSFDWLTLKAAGRIVLSKGQIGFLDAGTDPLANPVTGLALPAARRLNVAWTRWIVEPPASGTDAKGNRYHDLTYWNMCGPGATTVALYYWQQLTGHPNVTGKAGYFLDPYAAAGVAWPSGGPTFTSPNGQAEHLGTYWTGATKVSGFTAHARGYILYLAMAVKPAGWTAPGIDVFVGGTGKALYPTRGAPPTDMQAALNWEASGQVTNWAETYYATVHRWDPTLARDLNAAVMMDVGRDGVPVVAAVDTYYLPNWQAGSKTPHTRHAISIVGYDNTANPPTFTYLDTCGRSCNSRGGNQNGQIHVISQAQMAMAMADGNGMGFIW